MVHICVPGNSREACAQETAVLSSWSPWVHALRLRKNYNQVNEQAVKAAGATASFSFMLQFFQRFKRI